MPAIGIVTASGHFTLQGSEVWGNATLFDGSTVETTAASSQLALSNGVKMQLGAGSRARVFAGRLMLDKGVGQVAQAAPLREVDAAGFKIRGAGVRVGLGAPNRMVEVAALTGVAKVFGNGDVLLAAIPAGRHMNLSFQAAQTGTLTRTGCLVYKDAHYILQDDDTQEVVELAGNAQDFSKNLGNRIEIKGHGVVRKTGGNGGDQRLDCFRHLAEVAGRVPGGGLGFECSDGVAQRHRPACCRRCSHLRSGSIGRRRRTLRRRQGRDLHRDRRRRRRRGSRRGADAEQKVHQPVALQSVIMEPGFHPMIRNAKDLSPDQKAVIETLLGRRVLENEAISIRAIEPPALSDQRRHEQAADLQKYFSEVDALRKPGSAEEAEEILTEAMRSSRPDYRKHR